jgi:hypothetical protein
LPTLVSQQTAGSRLDAEAKQTTGREETQAQLLAHHVHALACSSDVCRSDRMGLSSPNNVACMKTESGEATTKL